MTHKTKFKTRIRWRDIEISKPKDEEHCLFQMKHAWISGHWSEKGQTGYTYVWRDVSYFPSHWVPMDELEAH